MKRVPSGGERTSHLFVPTEPRHREGQYLSPCGRVFCVCLANLSLARGHERGAWQDTGLLVSGHLSLELRTECLGNRADRRLEGLEHVPRGQPRPIHQSTHP